MPLMANKSPKHDFAPAWLKIPEDGGVPGKLRHTLDHPPGRPRRDEFYGGFPRFGGPGGPPDFYNGPLQRHGSYDNYERPRFSGPKMRHHSLDDDYYGYGGYPMPHPPPFYNEYPSNGFKGPNIRGQPPMFRGNADKYMHPNSRFASPNINGKYNPHYDNYYDGYHNDYYHPSSGRPPRGRSMYNESRSNKENRHVRNGTDKEEEFPSLNGDSSTNENQSGKRSQLSGAWENPPNKSQTSNNSPKRLPPESTNGMSPSGRIYKAVVPNKVLTRKLSKEAMMENFLKDKENQPKTINNNNNKASHKTNGVNGTSNHSKNEDNLDRVFTRKQSEPLLINGMSQLCVSNDESSLSSSLEAEQRLLREMGWTDTDEDDYEITEEEMKAFYDDLSKQGKAGKQNSVCAPAPSTNGTSVSGSNSLSNGTSNGESNGLSKGIVTDVTDLTDTDGENDAT